jgi:hypothetical protein
MHHTQVIKTRITGYRARQGNLSLIFLDDLNDDILGSTFGDCSVIIENCIIGELLERRKHVRTYNLRAISALEKSHVE